MLTLYILLCEYCIFVAEASYDDSACSFYVKRTLDLNQVLIHLTVGYCSMLELG